VPAPNQAESIAFPAALRPIVDTSRGWTGDVKSGRTVALPLLLLVASPLLVLSLWTVTVHHGGSLASALAAGSLVVQQLPRPSATAAVILLGWAALQWVLLVALPGPVHHGPRTREANRPQYRINGISAFVVTHALLLVAIADDWFAPDAFYRHYGELLATSALGAFVFCIALYLKGVFAPSSTDASRGESPVLDFFWGIELHPQLLGVELKQWFNCRIAMMGWSVTVLCFAAAQAQRTGAIDPALAVTVALQVVYVFKFFLWERGYFDSLDIAHDRFGFYICWGVLVWLPGVYPIAALALVDHPVALSWPVAAAIGAFGLFAIATNYAADAERQRVRATHGRTLVWGRPPVLIRARYTTADGHEHENLLLASGFWGIARHFHYVPELALAVAWTLPAANASVVPWFYVVFLSILLVDRARRDDRRCAEKYGAAWDEYRRRVPWRILPGVD
jgi:7-dehydrocholesterol reductase